MTEAEMYVVGLEILRGAMPSGDWATRRAALEAWRRSTSSPLTDPYPAGPRPGNDEFGWYLFVAEMAVNDPYGLDPDEAARVLPVVCGLASRWNHADRVVGLTEKLAELAGRRRATPDAGLFEVAVALAYAAEGFQVTMLPEQPGVKKTPDLKVAFENVDVYIECKRLSTFGDYEVKERQNWRRLWSSLEVQLRNQGNPLWLRIEFRRALDNYHDSYFEDRLKGLLTGITSEATVLDDDDIKFEARPVDLTKVGKHLKDVFVKVRGTQERALLGGTWAPPRAMMESFCLGDRMKPTSEIPPWKARSFWNKIHWGCGAAWLCTADESVDRKARDIKVLFSRAVEQLPADLPSIVHIAAETLSGNDVERRRTEKVEASVQDFRVDKPVMGMLFHRIQSESPPDGAFNFDESVSDYWRHPDLRDIFPRFVFLPMGLGSRKGGHWDYF